MPGGLRSYPPVHSASGQSAACQHAAGDPGWQAAHAIGAQASKSSLTGDQRSGTDAAIRYLTGNATFLRYDRALSAGWPIATGVIEGACRHLIGDRLDISGARWGLAGAEAVLKLRALIDNGDFDAYWRFHLAREHQRVHPPPEQERYDLAA